ncbi:MAG: hypothetical protein IJH50_13985 [Kiritimatiellae bacterium]|nr:hypothetical protein [Kiritimatiellia bacterium]
MNNRTSRKMLTVALVFVAWTISAIASDWSDVLEWVYDTSARSQYYAPPCTDSPLLSSAIDLRLRTINARAEVVPSGFIILFK